MPTSNLQLAPRILHLIWEVTHQLDRPSVLDVGPGLGKYGVLVREYVHRQAIVDAVEAEPRYITPRLEAIYDTVAHDDVARWANRRVDFPPYDVVLMVDVIEHLDKPDAMAALERIPSWAVICTPRHWFQNPEAADWPTETHRSHWEAEDFTSHPRFDYFDQDAYDHHGAIIVRLRPRR